MALTQYDWILALITIAFCCSAFGNGANDVANSYATSVAARTLTMPQVGFLSMITEFVGAVALGARVTDTIKNDIIDIDRFEGQPGVLILAMACAETGSATWLMIATRMGLPVSTTQTIVGALIGVGYASSASVSWAWDSGSVSQVAASWGIAPAIAACFAALLFATLKYAVLERREPLKWAMRLIPFYLAFTAAILALFIVIEAPTAPSLEEFGAGKACGIVLGVFFGFLAIAYIFFVPYFHRRLIKNDARVKAYHIPLGPLLWRDDVKLYYPADPNGEVVKDYYLNAHMARANSSAAANPAVSHSAKRQLTPPDSSPTLEPASLEKGAQSQTNHVRIIEPEERFLAPKKHLPIYHPSRMWSIVKYIMLQGVTRDCVTYNSEHLRKTHELAIVYDNKVEHLWTYAQVASAMIMSIAHGSNDVANAVGPWSAAYATYQAGVVETESPTPIWMLVIAGFLLGAGFWFFGYHIIRSLGNRLTQLSPTRGFSIELGAAITVLLASRLGLPVSTTQCLTGAVLGVALMNFQIGAVNWRQMLWILSGWIMTLPIAGLLAGLLMVMALNTPHF
jgi:solute carrier family 20 (sodium-dependent phosphate transporter)